MELTKEVIEGMIAEDTQGLLDIDKKGNYRIYGRINGKRGGAFFGFTEKEGGEPVFGGSNLIYAPIWWGKSWREVAEICDLIIARYPNCEATPSKCG